MTSLLVWVGVDRGGVSSLNVAADSRISFSNGDVWDHAIKVFASSRYPIALGFVGDVFFPSVTLPSAIARVDAGIYGTDTRDVVDSLVSDIQRSWRTFPRSHRHGVTILVAYRLAGGMKSVFGLKQLIGAPGAPDIQDESVAMPSRSAFVLLQGSGEKSVGKALGAWQQSDAQGTSRAAYSAFVDALLSGGDPFSGGAPQLVSIWRNHREAHPIPVVYLERRFIFGTEIEGERSGHALTEWRGPLFERVDGKTGRLLTGAQPHIRPSNV